MRTSHPEVFQKPGDECCMAEQRGSAQVQTSLVFVEEASLHYDRIFALLCAEEQARAARFLSADARNEFVIGRGSLRLLLAAFLHRRPRSIQFTTGNQGKPQVDGVQFNLSHSSGLIALALSSNCPVGIDIEREDRAVEVLDVAEMVLDAEQQKLLRSTRCDLERRRLFFQMWTAEEAQAKCLGLGLAHLDEVRCQRDHFHVQPLSVPAGYRGSLCLAGRAEVTSAILSGAALGKLLDSR